MNDELLQKAAGRDPKAFVQLMQSYMQSMYKTARAILSNDEDVADAIQETILRCWEKTGSLKNPEFFKTWMSRVIDPDEVDAILFPNDTLWQKLEDGNDSVVSAEGFDYSSLTEDDFWAVSLM